MATWFEIKDYLRSHHKVESDQDSFVKLLVDVDGRRSQVVFVTQHLPRTGEVEWLHIESPFARMGGVELRAVLVEVGNLVCGGLSLMGDFLTIRHSVPLATLDIAEFAQPLALVSGTADRLEREFLGADAF